MKGVVFKQNCFQTDKRLNIIAAIFSIIFSWINVYVFVAQNNPFSGFKAMFILWNVLVVTCIVFVLIRLIYISLPAISLYVFQDERDTVVKSDLKYYFVVATLIFLMWMPVFLAYYPGLFAYDVRFQLNQSFGSYNTHHPLIHTLYLVFFYRIIGKNCLRDVSLGIAIASLFQMILFSLMISFSHHFLRRMNVRKSIRYSLIILSGILPIFSMMSISMTKDVLFAGWFCVLFTLLCYYVSGTGYFDIKYSLLYCFSVIGCVIFRKNALYSTALATLMLLFIALKFKKYKLLSRLTLLGLVIAISINMILSTTLKASPGSRDEFFSVPYQQMACVYEDHKSDLSETEIQSIFKVIPNVEKYKPYLYDPIKGGNADSFSEFVQLYVRLGLRYPQSYIKGFLLLNAGYLSVTDKTYSEIYGTDNRQGVLLTDTHKGFGVKHKSYFRWLENLYETLYTNNEYHYILVLRILCSPAFYTWSVLLLVMYAIIMKRYNVLIPAIFWGMLFLTMLAGPCVLVRYALPYILCVPALFVSVARGAKC